MRWSVAVLGVLVALNAACEGAPSTGDSDAEVDGGTERPSPSAGGPLADLPLLHTPADAGERPRVPVIRFPEASTRGGPVIEHPNIQVITFAGDPRADDIETFVKRLETSSYFEQVTSEYGVGALGAMSVVRLPEVAPKEMKAGQIAEWLRGKLSDGSLGTPNSQTLYALFYPKVTLIEEDGAKSCESFGGYHDEVSAENGTRVGYAVLPQCSAGVLAATEVDTLTYSASHEIIEWATDPFPRSMPAWNSVTSASAPWMYAFAAELADLCVQPGVDSVVPDDLGYAVQRSWSNRSSLAGHHPCVPSAGLPYVAAVPIVEDLAHVSDLGSPEAHSMLSPVIGLRVGAPRKFKVAIYSDSPEAIETDLFVETYEENSATSFSLPSSAHVGDVLELTVTARKPIAGVERAFVLSVPTMRNMISWPFLLVDEANLSDGFAMLRPSLVGHLVMPKHRSE